MSSSSKWVARQHLFEPPPPPPSALARYRPLCPAASLRVSGIMLGGMSIGDRWAHFGMGAMDKESSFKLLDAHYEAGGNFIDTANHYQDQTSEEFIGEWMEIRGVRREMVISTKYTAAYERGSSAVPPAHHRANFSGNSSKSLRLSLEDSLRKLRTDYVDILFVHCLDWLTSVEEMMQSLNQLVLQGKVLYLGVSYCPAWYITRANQYARDHGMAQFVIFQANWNCLNRELEREYLAMARYEGMALSASDCLHGGRIRTNAEEARREASGENGRQVFSPEWKRTLREREVCDVLEEIAKEVGVDENIQAVALAWLLLKAPNVYPCVGMRKVSQLEANIKALDINLSPEQMKRIDEAGGPLVRGIPYDIIGDGAEFGFQQTIVYETHADVPPLPQPIRPIASGPPA